jgi:hypothetical protein
MTVAAGKYTASAFALLHLASCKHACGCLATPGEGSRGGNHHAPVLRGDDHRGCSIGADRRKNFYSVNGSAIHAVTAFHRIPIMRISAKNAYPQYDGCSDEKKETNTDIAGPKQTLVSGHGKRHVCPLLDRKALDLTTAGGFRLPVSTFGA